VSISTKGEDVEGELVTGFGYTGSLDADLRVAADALSIAFVMIPTMSSSVNRSKTKTLVEA